MGAPPKFIGPRGGVNHVSISVSVPIPVPTFCVPVAPGFMLVKVMTHNTSRRPIKHSVMLLTK